MSKNNLALLLETSLGFVFPFLARLSHTKSIGVIFKMKQGRLIFKSKEKKYLLVECRLVKGFRDHESTCRISNSFECFGDFRVLLSL
jgi:hypothetical protein